MSDFKELRAQGVYVDKTEALHQLIEEGRYRYANIISRPVGFGKSTTLSTLKYIFEGKRELFKGLAIDKTDYAWKPWPVIYMDMAEAVGETLEEVEAKLLKVVRAAVGEEFWGTDDYASTYASGAFSHALFEYERREQRVVVLVDNFDAPARAVLDRPKLATEIVSRLNNVYIHLKSSCATIEFLLVAGEMPYATLITSVFSGVNNFSDLSLYPDYAALCGFTDEELEAYFGEDMHAHAAKMGLPYETYRSELSRWFGGYRFEDHSAPLYNPQYVKHVLKEQAPVFDDSWVPECRSVLLKFVTEADRQKTEDYRSWKDDPATDYAQPDYASYRELCQWCCDPEHYMPEELLYRAGYLTILKPHERGVDLFYMGIPNEAVRRDMRRLGLKVSETSETEE